MQGQELQQAVQALQEAQEQVLELAQEQVRVLGLAAAQVRALEQQEQGWVQLELDLGPQE